MTPPRPAPSGGGRPSATPPGRAPRGAGGRLSAEERRAAVLAVAVTEFARGGYAGTSTETIADRAGISQPYLFRLFGTKRDLFVATIGLMHARIEETFRAAADGRHGFEALDAMGQAYKDLLQERELLRVQLHAYAASDDPVIRQAARDGFGHLWSTVEALTGLPGEAVRMFFAMGMLHNVLAAMDATSLKAGWVEACEQGPEELLQALAHLHPAG